VATWKKKGAGGVGPFFFQVATRHAEALH